MVSLRNMVATFLMYIVSVQGVQAQAVQFDSALIREGCLQGVCVQTVRTTVDQIQRQQLSPAEFNSQLGAVAAVLFQTAREADEYTLAQLAEALRLLALYSTDAAQRQSFVLVANQISNGEGTLFDLEAPFAASPA